MVEGLVFRGEFQFIHNRRAGRYPVCVYQMIGHGIREAFVVRPETVGGQMDGCFCAGRTADEAIDRLAQTLPGLIRFFRQNGLGTPRPRRFPVTLAGINGTPMEGAPLQ